jgi:hypothetical protein
MYQLCAIVAHLSDLVFLYLGENLVKRANHMNFYFAQ